MAQAYVIGRVTEDLEFKVSTNHHPYVRFTVAETIGSGRQVRTQYLQICAFGTVVERLKQCSCKEGKSYLGVRFPGAGGILQAGRGTR